MDAAPESASVAVSVAVTAVLLQPVGMPEMPVVGGVRSMRTVADLAASTLPTASVDLYMMLVWPSVVTLIGPACPARWTRRSG